MANAEVNEVESAPIDANAGGKRKSRTKLIVGVVVLLALAAGGFAFFHMRSASKGGAATPSVKAPEIFLPLEPAFVVNFQGDDSARYLQVGVTVMARDQAAIQAIKDNDPIVRNALVILFSSQTVDQLNTTAGKQKLQSEALAAVRKIVADHQVKADVEALYFTSFVMQ